MKKSLVSIALCFVLAFGGTANAFVPAVIPVILIGAGALIAAGLNLGVLYSMVTSDGTSHLVNSSGDISRKSEAKYIEIDMSNLPVVKTDPVHAKMPFDKVRQISDKQNPDGSYKYPAVHGALQTVSPQEVISPETLLGSNVGRVTKINGSWYQLNSYVGKYVGYIYNPPVHTTPFIQSGLIYVPYGPAGSYYSQVSQDMAKYSYVSSPGPVMAPAPIPTAVFNLSGSDGGGSVLSGYQAELDAMFQDPDYVPVFTDDTTGLPYAPPAGLPSSAQIKAAVDAYNRAGALAESKSSVQAANAGAVAAAQAAADAAHAAAQSAAGASAANPGDAGLANAAAQAAAGAAAADAALAQTKADQAKSDNAFTNMSATVSDNTPAVAESTDGGTATGLGGLLINRLKTTAGLLATHAPLSYISGAVDLVSSLVVAPVAPSIDLPLGPWGGTLHISAGWFDPLATLTRFFSWLLFILSAAWSFKGYWHRS